MRFDSTRTPHEYVSIISQRPQLKPVHVVYLPGCASITLLTSTSTCNDDRLSGSLSSSSSASKAAGDLKASKALSLNSNLCGLANHYVYLLMAPSRSSSSCDSCDDGTLSSRKNLQRTLQKIRCCCRRLHPIAALPWI